jgi:hypothetical protein
MLSDARTWTTLAYLIVMLPLGIIYFTTAVTGIAFGLSCIAAPVIDALQHLGWVQGMSVYGDGIPHWLTTPMGSIVQFFLGVFLITSLMHVARGIGRMHAKLAKPA